MFELMVAWSIVASLVLSVVFILYVFFIVVPFLTYRPSADGDASVFQWHLFVPCRDEEAVIGHTVRYLRTTFPEAHVWVIDDDSEDDTAVIVKVVGSDDPLVHLVQRRRPHARTGKGDALNAAYAELDAWLDQDVDRSRVIVGVIDADGRPSESSLRACAADDAFGTPRIGAVQTEVRMINRDQREPFPGAGPLHNWFARVLVRMQDLEFRAPIAAMQISRRISRTVNIGGNGQYTRLSALDFISREFGSPWHGSLLEDYELGVHLMLGGWSNVHTCAAWVDQEALPDLRRLVRQRTRWSLGSMQCLRYFTAVWRSRKITNLGAIEISYFLLQPWLTLLGTFIFTLPVAALVAVAAVSPGDAAAFMTNGGWMLYAMYVVIGIGVFAVWGPLYRSRCEPSTTWPRALGWGLAYVPYALLYYVIVWRAAGRFVMRRDGWAKTRRNAENLSVGPVAREH